FCYRQRQFVPGSQAYYLDSSTILVNDTKIAGTIHNHVNEQKLSFELCAYQYSTFRITIDKIFEGSSAYKIPPGDVVNAELPEHKIISDIQGNVILVHAKIGDLAAIYMNPFKVEFFKEGKLVTIFNGRGLLNFEGDLQYSLDRTDGLTSNFSNSMESLKPEISSESNMTHQNAEHSWSENFKTHVDSRPYGPSSLSLDIDFNGFEFVYGIPEHADGFVLKNTDNTDPYRLYNLDVFEYELNNPMALYGSVPLMWAHRKNMTVGLLWHNPSETWIDIKSNRQTGSGIFGSISNILSARSEIPSVKTRWMSESGVVDVFLIIESNP
ncbi:unnamed protein product, partial [Protopolystoma xenopodis]